MELPGQLLTLGLVNFSRAPHLEFLPARFSLSRFRHTNFVLTNNTFKVNVISEDQVHGYMQGAVVGWWSVVSLLLHVKASNAKAGLLPLFRYITEFASQFAHP